MFFDGGCLPYWVFCVLSVWTLEGCKFLWLCHWRFGGFIAGHSSESGNFIALEPCWCCSDIAKWTKFCCPKLASLWPPCPPSSVRGQSVGCRTGKETAVCSEVMCKQKWAHDHSQCAQVTRILSGRARISVHLGEIARIFVILPGFCDLLHV